MRRAVQVASWIVVAPFLGGIQAIATFLIPMLWHGDVANRDLRTLLVGLAVGYGGMWLLPALVLADIVFLRRALSRRDYVQYILTLTIAAGGIGVVMPGMLAMVAYPVMAAFILACGFWYRGPNTVDPRRARPDSSR
jgi:hypothetical protein